MKKFAISLSCLLLLSSCANETNLAPINLDQQQSVVQSLAAKANLDTLIKKMNDKRFTFADKDKNKKLIFSEFKVLESEHDDVMKEMFDSFDKNKDAIVTYEEFAKSSSEGIKNTLNQMFGMLDMNRNSFIDQGEEIEMVADIAYNTAKDSGVKVTMAEVIKDYLSYDADKNGKLSLAEYQLPEMKYILMAPVDPYKNSISKTGNPISLNKLINNIKNRLKK